jgi:hypothetical protein
VTVYQAFVDESYREGGEYVLAGHIASAESWIKFAEDWEKLLPTATRDRNGNFRFKMKEMATDPIKLGRVENFYKVIEKYVLVSISARLNIKDFERAINSLEREYAKKGLLVRLKNWDSPYFMLALGLIQSVAENREKLKELIPENVPIDFIFDENTEKRPILRAWSEFVSTAPDWVSERLGNTPRFENDEAFLPLQASDLWAWWIRKWYEEDFGSIYPPSFRDLDFGAWKGKPRPLHIMYMREKNVFEKLNYIVFQALQRKDNGNGADAELESSVNQHLGNAEGDSKTESKISRFMMSAFSWLVSFGERKKK